MIIVPPIAFLRRRRPKPAAPPAPPTLNTILHVRRTVDEDWFLVELSEPIVEAGAPAGMLEVSVDGSTWFAARLADVDDDAHFVEINFDEALPDAALWRVPTPGNWIFADAATLDAPLAGTIEEE